jgi:aminoglycoside phosphotransferase (APT) family kinase protein
MERIDGPDLLTLAGSRPWTVFRMGRICGDVQARLHATKASRRMPAVRDVLRQWMESSDRVPKHLAEFARDILKGLPDGDALCHGDFHPANILMAGETPVVIDWANAMRGDPAADVGRSLVLFGIGEVPPGSPVLVRYLHRIGSKIVTWGYLRAYRRARPLDMELVERWVVAHAAARLAFERIPEEEGPLVRLLERPYST